MAVESSSQSVRSSLSRRRALLYGLLLLGGVMRLGGLGAKCLWVDEIDSVVQSATIERLIAYCRDGHTPPLRYLLVWALQRAPATEFAIRLPAALFGTLSIALIWWLGERLWDWRIGAVAAVLLTLSPWHLLHSQDARYYAVILFLALAALALALHLVGQPRSRWRWILLAVCCALNLYISYVAFFPVAAVGGYLLWSASRASRSEADSERARALARGIALAAVVGFLCLLPWLPAVLGVFGRYVGDRGDRATAPAGPNASAHSASPRRVLAWPTQFSGAYLDDYAGKLGLQQPVMKFALLGLFAVGLIRGARHPRHLGMLAALWFLLPWMVILATAMRHFCPPRYLFHYLGLYLLFGAAGAVAVWDWLIESIRAGHGCASGGDWRRAAFRLQIAVIMLAAFVAYGRELVSYYRAEKQDWRATVRFLDQFAGPADAVFTGAFLASHGLRYYWFEMTKPISPPAEEIVGARLADQLSFYPRVWYVTCGPSPEDVRSVLAARFQQVHVFPGLQSDIHVYRSTVPEGGEGG